ncbi:restriction endonuclease [Paenibacillus hunanensis]|uniref:restriction endonuclease n=1 Tax=Paenibacillus hunanensis TaxID=539262 RepID=UPI0020265C0B|nr:restriction endonuclease [Paenibacillus hunanensis]
MAKRKSKKRQEAEFFEAVCGLAAITGGAVGYLTTKDFTVSIFMAIIMAGIVIFCFFLKKQQYEQRLRDAGITQIDKMSGTEFEVYLGKMFDRLGYKTKVTQASGDFGADIILQTADKRIVVQAKRYKGNVPIEAVQQVFAAAPHYKANSAWVVTNSDYTRAAYTLAKSTNVRLINREQLIELILKSKQSQKSKTIKPLEKSS